MYGWEFPPHISGGLGVACFEMTRALRELGHEITFVVPRLKEGVATAEHVRLLGMAQFASAEQRIVETETQRFLEGIEIRAIESPLRPYLTDPEYKEIIEKLQRIHRERHRSAEGFHVTFTGDYGPDLISEVVRYAQVAGAVAATVPHDVIHAHDWLTMLAGVEARRVSGKPLVLHVHALEFDRSGENVNQAVYDIERFGMRQADRVVAVSQLTKQTIVNRYDVAPNKVDVVYNAVSSRPRTAGAARAARRDRVVLFLGRITFQKGPDYFVEAAGKVLAGRDDVRFVMAGSGDMAPRVIQRVAELRIGKRFHFTGFLTGAAVDRMYEESDIYVMPSVSEPFGISPLEAMCHDVPVIISRQSGVAEVLKHTLKVDFWDVEDLANKINALLDHPSLRDELVRQGSRELESLKWGNAAKRLTGIYEQLAAAAG
jgi:glycosyltransferase involved in cell wall biosynthesis